jgi:hypothetical protein
MSWPTPYHPTHSPRHVRSGRYSRSFQYAVYNQGTVSDSEWDGNGEKLRASGDFTGNEGCSSRWRLAFNEWVPVYRLVSLASGVARADGEYLEFESR